MPTSTTNFAFNKPLVNDPVDEDIWGGQLNANWDSADTIIDALMPIGSMIAYAGTTAPNSRWALCDGSAISRTTFATLFALISTSYGVGDGSTTFNLPDYRGRAGVGLDNLGGSSADRITDGNADSLNNTGGGDETPSGSLSGTTDSHALTTTEMPSHTHGIQINSNTDSGATQVQGGDSGVNSTIQTASAGSGSGHTHNLTTATVTGSAGDNLQPWIAEGRIIRTN